MDELASKVYNSMAAVEKRREGDEPMLQFFTFGHLPAPLQVVSEAFYNLAHDLTITLPRNPERTACLRKLLEAKDCAVRARIYRP